MARAKSTIQLDLDDPRAEKIAEIISSASAKKILGELANSEEALSESEVAEKLGMPLNTIGYNIKKLLEAGLIEKASGVLWSVKGKRIHKYTVAEKKIVLTPRVKMKGVFPAIMGTVVVAAGLKIWMMTQQTEIANAGVADELARTVASGAFAEGGALMAQDAALKSAGEGLNYAASSGVLGGVQIPFWFLLGAATAIVIFMIWNWRAKNE